MINKKISAERNVSYGKRKTIKKEEIPALDGTFPVGLYLVLALKPRPVV